MSKSTRIRLDRHGLTLYSPFSSMYVGWPKLALLGIFLGLVIGFLFRADPFLGLLAAVTVAYVLLTRRVGERGNPPPYGSPGAGGIRSPLVPVAPLVGSDEKAFPQDRSA